MKPSAAYAAKIIYEDFRDRAIPTSWDDLRWMLIDAYEQGAEDAEWRLREALRGETLQ